MDKIWDIDDYKIHFKEITINNVLNTTTSQLNQIKFIMDQVLKCKYFISNTESGVKIRIPFIKIGYIQLIKNEYYDDICKYDDIPDGVLDDYLDNNKVVELCDQYNYETTLRLNARNSIIETIGDKDLSLVWQIEDYDYIDDFNMCHFDMMRKSITKIGAFCEYKFDPETNQEYIRIPYIENKDNPDELYLLREDTKDICDSNINIAIMTGLLIKAPEDLRYDIDFLFKFSK